MGPPSTHARSKIKDDVLPFYFAYLQVDLFGYIQSLVMGNNHDKYFGSDKRKIIILGLDNAGKTSKVWAISAFLKYVSKETVDFNTEKTKNLNIEDVKIKDLSVTFFVL